MLDFANNDAVKLQYRARFLAAQSRGTQLRGELHYAKQLQEQSKLYYAAVRALLNLEG